MGKKAQTALKFAKGAKKLAGKASGKTGKMLDKLAMLGSSTAAKQQKADQNLNGFRAYLYEEHRLMSAALAAAQTAANRNDFSAVKKALKGSKKSASNIAANAKKYKRYDDEFNKYDEQLDKVLTAIKQAATDVEKMAADPDHKHGVNF